jgi:hypothetical protein
VRSFAGTPQPAGTGVHCWFAGLDFHCLSSTLRAGTEPRRVHLGLLEAARVTQCLPQGLLATERSSKTNAASHAPPSATDHGLLETIFSMARMTLYYASLNKCCRINRTEVEKLLPEPIILVMGVYFIAVAFYFLRSNLIPTAPIPSG